MLDVVGSTLAQPGLEGFTQYCLGILNGGIYRTENARDFIRIGLWLGAPLLKLFPHQRITGTRADIFSQSRYLLHPNPISSIVSFPRSTFSRYHTHTHTHAPHFHIPEFPVPPSPQNYLPPIFPVLNPDHVVISRTERGSGSSSVSRPFRNTGHPASQGGRVQVHSQSTIRVILKVAGSTRS